MGACKRLWFVSTHGRRKRLVAVLAVWLATIVGCDSGTGARVSTAGKRSASRPNILLILIDTLRADRLGCYGNTQGLSPAIDAIAADGVTFERVIAPSPWTQPSIVGLFTGIYPGAIRPIGDYRQTFDSARRRAKLVRVLEEEYTTMAEALRDVGYTTAAVITNPYISRAFGLAQGFDHFDVGLAEVHAAGDAVNDAAVQWLAEREPGKPFFLYLHYMDVHGPYDGGPAFLDPLLDVVDRLADKHALSDAQMKQLDPRYLLKLPKSYTNLARHERLMRYREYWQARYEAGVAELDHHLAALQQRLGKMGLWDDLTVIVTSDHGEALGEHGYFSHGLSVHHTELHVPLIIRSPGRLPKSKRVPETVRLIDVMPTLLDHLGAPPVDEFQGGSLLPYVAGNPPAEPITAVCEGLKIESEQFAIYRGEWKVVILPDPSPMVLYRFATDPLGRSNVVKQNLAVFRLMQDLAARQRAANAALAANAQREAIQLSDEQMRRLEALGYIGGARSKQDGDQRTP